MSLSVEQVLGLPPPEEVDEDALSLDEIFDRCAMSHGSSTPSLPRYFCLDDPNSYRIVWTAFLEWILDASQQNKPLAIGDIGTITFRLYTMGIRVPFFSVDPQFKAKYQLSQNHDRSYAKGKICCPTNRIVQATGIDEECCLFALQTVSKTIGSLARQGYSLNVSFGIGTLFIHRRQTRFEFTQQQNSSPRRPRQQKYPRSSSSSLVANQPRYGRFLHIAATTTSNLSPSQQQHDQFREYDSKALKMIDLKKIDEQVSISPTTPSRMPLSRTHPLEPVLDPHARLRAATFKSAKHDRASVSATIALHFSYIDGEHPVDASGEGQLVDFSLSPRRIEEEEANDAPRPKEDEANEMDYPPEQAALYDAYLKDGIPDHAVEKIASETLAAIMKRMNASSTHLKDESSALHCVVSALRTGHVKSIKKSILDYVLLSNTERKRLGLPLGTPHDLRLSNPLPPPEPPEYLGAKCRRARKALQKNLIISAKPFYDCHRVWWRQYQNIVLVRLPSLQDGFSSIDDAGRLPQTITNFEARQMERIEQVRSMIKEKWMPLVAKIFLRGEESFNEKYLNLVAIVMANQLNQIVRNSLQTLLEFFESFLHEKCAFQPVFFLVPNLKDSNGMPGISLHGTAKNLRASMTRILEKIVNCFKDVERIEDWQRRRQHTERREEKDPVVSPPESPDPQTPQVPENMSYSDQLLEEEEEEEEDAEEEQEEKESVVEESAAISTSCEQSEISILPDISNDEELCAAKERLMRVIEDNLKIASCNIEVYRPFESLLGMSHFDELKLATTPASADESERQLPFEKRTADSQSVQVEADLSVLGSKISEYHRIASEVATSRDFQDMPLFELDIDGLHGYLVDQALKAAQGITTKITEQISIDVKKVAKTTRSAVLALQQRPKTTAELVVAQASLEKARSVDLVQLRAVFKVLWKRVEFLADKDSLNTTVLDAVRQAHHETRELQAQIEKAADQQVTERTVIKESIERRREEIRARLERISTRIRCFADKGNAKLIREYIDQLIDIRKTLAEEIVGVEAFNEEETKLELQQITDFSQSLRDVNEELEPYEQLWTTALKFHMSYSTWVKGPIRSIDGDVLTSDHAEMFEKFTRLSKILATVGAIEPAKFASSIRAQLDRFAPNLPILRGLSSKKLTPEHWERVSKIIGYKLSAENLTSLANLLEITEISPAKASEIDAIAREVA